MKTKIAGKPKIHQLSIFKKLYNFRQKDVKLCGIMGETKEGCGLVQMCFFAENRALRKFCRRVAK